MRPTVVAILVLFAGCGPDTPPSTAQAVQINVNPKDKVDVLFMVDNSESMTDMQDALKKAFFHFFKPFDELVNNHQFVDFRIGVITSDYGAGHGVAECDASAGGQRGALQTMGADADPQCMPPVGAAYIHYSTDPNAPNNLPQGQDLAATFTCMASVGAKGCGYEHQLESAYAALHGNPGFLRDDAALAVAFLTNEDDGSAPSDTDVFDVEKTAQYGFNSSYPRQTRHAVVCCPPGQDSCPDSDLKFPPYGSSKGPLHGCRPAPNPPGKQFDVRRYIDFFTQPAAKGGVKEVPEDVILFAIDGPDTPFEVILSPSGVAPIQSTCPALVDDSIPVCLPVLKHSCANPDVPGIFGDPAVRLNTVVRAAASHRIWSICDGDYASALRSLGESVVYQLGSGCLANEAFAGLTADQVTCSVSDVASQVDQGSVTPIAACTNGVFPCWRLESKKLCSAFSSQSLGLTVDRNGQPAPAGTRVRATCQKK